MNYDVVFYVQYPYYYPHFLPIAAALKKENLTIHFVLSKEQNTALIVEIAEKLGLEYTLGDDECLKNINTKNIFFANVPSKNLQTKAKKIFLCHGIGTKQCGFENALERCDVVFVEGSYRDNLYRNKFPQYVDKIQKVGYSKLDPIVNIGEEERKEIHKKYSLDSTKKTILYAPTFFPSSIEKMSDSFPDDFQECNILVKAHYLTWERDQYKKQLKKFELWKRYTNCQIIPVDEYNLIPFIMVSDIMISDESSAIFEFASLNKPVIINRFLKLRWSYYVNPKKLLKRMDKNMDKYRIIGPNPQTYQEMLEVTKKNLTDSNIFEEARLSLAQEICGKIDGKVSQRITKVIKDISAK